MSRYELLPPGPAWHPPYWSRWSPFAWRDPATFGYVYPTRTAVATGALTAQLVSTDRPPDYCPDEE